MKLQVHALVIPFAFMLLSACQLQGDNGTYSQQQERELATALDKMKLSVGEPVTNVFNFTIKGFQTINETSLVLDNGIKDQYLLKFDAPCIGLRYTISVALISNGSVLRSFDYILVNVPGNPQEQCRIKDIYKLAKKPQ